MFSALQRLFFCPFVTSFLLAMTRCMVDCNDFVSITASSYLITGVLWTGQKRGVFVLWAEQKERAFCSTVIPAKAGI